MKIRGDYVTNSSSSSFIISKDKITHGHLLDILLEMANEEVKDWCEENDEYAYDWSDVRGNGVGHFNIKEFTGDDAYLVYKWYEKSERVYKDVFVVDNDDTGRYNWGAVAKVLNKHGLELIKGNCD